MSNWFEWLGIAGLLAMMLVTVIDVAGAKLFSWRLLGAIDIVQLSQTVAIAFAAATTLIAERHVRVEFIIVRFSLRGQAVFDIIVNFLCSGLFLLFIWRMTVLGLTFQRTGEGSPTIYTPLQYFAYGMALAMVPVLVMYLLNLVKSVYQAAGR